MCTPCYDAALRRRGTCHGCHTTRRLIDPPGPAATRCADCADCAGRAAIGHICLDCGTEDKLHSAGRCDRCALARRIHDLLADDSGEIPDRLFTLAAAIAAAPNARSALNWLRTGAAAAILTELTTGRLDPSHDTLDTHPRRRAADYLRRMLVAHDLLPGRDEDLDRTRRFIHDTLADITRPADRRLVQAYATWQVLRRLRRRAETNPRPRTYTRHATDQIKAAVRLLDWLADRGTPLAEMGQRDLDAWLATRPGAYAARDFTLWAADAGYAPPLTIPAIRGGTGTATDPDTRWQILARLLHDDTLELTDRVAGCLVLLYAQPLSRITVITRDRIDHRHDHTALTLRFGADPVTIPQPLAGLIADLLDTGRRYVGVGSPDTTPWLFPGLYPGQPLTAARLGVRLGKLGIDGRAGRRAALTHLAAELPAAVLAELLGISNHSAVNWVRDAGGGWSRYAAELAHERADQPAE